MTLVLEGLSIDEIITMAANDNFDNATFHALATHENVLVRRQLTKNFNCPKEFYVILSQDSDKRVRSLLAHNQMIPVEAMANLIMDEEDSTRATVSRSKNFPFDLFCIASLSDSEFNRYLYDGVRTAAELVRKIGGKSLPHEMQASHQNTPVDVLVELAMFEEGFTLLSLAGNTNMPAEVLNMFLGNDIRLIREHAVRALEKKQKAKN